MTTTTTEDLLHANTPQWSPAPWERDDWPRPAGWVVPWPAAMEPAPWERDDLHLRCAQVRVVGLPQWSPLLGSGMTQWVPCAKAHAATCRNGARSLGAG